MQSIIQKHPIYKPHSHPYPACHQYYWHHFSPLLSGVTNAVPLF
ncbi:hypothetical [Yersinia pestis KIM10+]|uniref:Uncharacterized protein n=1 Tax=Yersinia pestis TaxID=632 RepID=Q8CLB0_YERPE|nr:hypothetical [Yersinia pestis KIM10+]